MPTSVKQVIKTFSKERQEKINIGAKKMIREYNTLQEIRKSLGITQDQIAKKQGVKQVNISNLEKRNDMLISTLKKYVEAIGGQLEINIKLPKS